MNKQANRFREVSRGVVWHVNAICLLVIFVSNGSVFGEEEKTRDTQVVAPDVTTEDAAKLEKLRTLVQKKDAAPEKAKEKAGTKAELAAEDANRDETVNNVAQGDGKEDSGQLAEPDPADLQAMEYFRRFSRGEVYLIYKCCDLTAEEISRLSQSGEKEIRRLFEQRRGRNPAAEMLRENGIVRIFPNGRRATKIPLDTRGSIRMAISKEAEKILSKERYDRYQAEIDKREESRKRASIQLIVARIDRDLLFTTSQREKLVDVLVKSLNGSEFSSPEEVLLYSHQQQIPPLPAKFIEPLLTESQKSAWRKLPKTRNQFNYDEMMMNRGGNLLSISEEEIAGLKPNREESDTAKSQQEMGN